MTQTEKTALIRYLDFHLLKLCEQIESNVDPDAIGYMYKIAYDIVDDLKLSIVTNPIKNNR